MSRRRDVVESRSARPSRAALAKRATKSTKKRESEAGDVAESSQHAKEAANQRALAITAFDAAIKKMQSKDYAAAAKLFRELLESHPAARDLHDRVRSYLRICDRQLQPADSQPATADELYARGIVELNRGELDTAIDALNKSLAKDKGADRVEFALAVAFAGKGDATSALAHLKRAVEINPDNRILAANDSDLQLLRDDPEYYELIRSRSK